MKQRIEYIDAVKGFAIFLVVLGHTIGWQFTNFERFEMGGAVFLWKVIYSFHMPLFMFCSGLFFSSYENSCIKDVANNIGKRFMTLMVPYVIMGILGHFLFGRSYFLYWFLITLFLFFCLNTCVVVLLRKCKIYSVWTECIIYAVLSLALLFVGIRVPLNYEGVCVVNLSVYPYYCLGIIFSRFNLAEKWLEKNWLYSLSIVVFAVSLYCFIGSHGIINLASGMLTAISGIFLTMAFFKCMPKGKIFGLFNKMGIVTLEIYLLHFIFLVNLPFLGNFYLNQFEEFGFGGTFVPQLVISVILASLNITLCLVLRELLSHSSLLSKLLLGRTLLRQ